MCCTLSSYDLIWFIELVLVGEKLSFKKMQYVHKIESWDNSNFGKLSNQFWRWMETFSIKLSIKITVTIQNDFSKMIYNEVQMIFFRIQNEILKKTNLLNSKTAWHLFSSIKNLNFSLTDFYFLLKNIFFPLKLSDEENWLWAPNLIQKFMKALLPSSRV